MNSAIRFLAAVFICVAISVHSFHLYILVTHPEAVKDGQYAVSFMTTGAFGWVAGVALFFGIRRMTKKEPRVTPFIFAVFSVYAVLMATAAIAYEGLKLGPASSHSALFLVEVLPIVMVRSPMGLPLVLMSPSFLWVELAAFAPLVLFLAVLSRTLRRRLDPENVN